MPDTVWRPVPVVLELESVMAYARSDVVPAVPKGRRRIWPRVLMALVPVLSLGLLCAVPSVVMAIRHRSRANGIACGFFAAVTVAWVVDLGLTPESAHGLEFVGDTLLELVSMAGAAVHCLLAWPGSRPGPETGPVS